MAAEARTIAVCGSTGRQGGAVSRHLLAAGWKVRALTRRPNRLAARTLNQMGAEVIEADMNDHGSLRTAFDGTHGVFSVQNGLRSGFAREVEQGRNVANAAREAGVGHLLYGSAGTGQRGTGIPSWEAKLEVEDHMKQLGLPVTTLRPQAFMELMTDKDFYPAVGTWRIWPMLSGEDLAVPWLAVEDVGAIAARIFSQPADFVGRELVLAADVQTLARCRSIYHEVMGKDPPTFPMPVWLFDRFTRKDISTMWRWVRTGTIELDTGPTRALLPSAMSVREWLERIRDSSQKEAIKA